MMLTGFERVKSDNLARAIAIMLVVANHSSYHPLGGGMNFLLFMAGFNFAAFSFTKSTNAIITDFFSLVSKILLPALFIIVFYALFFKNIVWEELLFVSFILSPENGRNALLPVWYCQVLLQIFIMLVLVFKAVDFSRWIKTYPIRTTLISLILTSSFNLIFLEAYPWDRHPHMYLWNFCLGWSVWALVNSCIYAKRTISVLLTVFVSTLIFIPSIQLEESNAYRVIVFNVLSIIFILSFSLKMPRMIALGINLVSKATLYIFLFHWTFIVLYQSHYSIDELGKWDSIISFSAGVIWPVAIWVLCVSIRNAIKRYQYQ